MGCSSLSFGTSFATFVIPVELYHKTNLQLIGKSIGSTLLTVILPPGEKEQAREWKTPPVSSSLVFARNNEAKENRRCQTIVNCGKPVVIVCATTA
jgi:hypothetical protein